MNRYAALLAARRFVVFTLHENKALCESSAVSTRQIAKRVLGSESRSDDVTRELYALCDIGQTRRVSGTDNGCSKWFLTERGQFDYRSQDSQK